MQSQDHFDRQFDDLVAAFEAWAERLRGVAEVSAERSSAFWRLRAEPHLQAACPVELIVHRNQTYDIMIGAEAYEGLTLESPDALLPLLDAVADGRACTTMRRSAATDTLLEIETILMPTSAPIWRRSRNILTYAGGCEAVTTTRHYPPYRRN